LINTLDNNRDNCKPYSYMNSHANSALRKRRWR